MTIIKYAETLLAANCETDKYIISQIHRACNKAGNTTITKAQQIILELYYDKLLNEKLRGGEIMSNIEQTLAYAGQKLRESVYNNTISRYDVVNESLNIIRKDWESSLNINSKGCEYCEEGAYNKALYDDHYIYICIDDNKLSIQTHDIEDLMTHKDNVIIKECPMCGRKLKGDLR